MPDPKRIPDHDPKACQNLDCPLKTADTLRDHLIIDTLQAIRDNARATSEATAMIARAIAVQTETVGTIATALALGERVKALETRDVEQQESMNRHREEHRAITGKAFSLMIGALVTLAGALVSLWVAMHP